MRSPRPGRVPFLPAVRHQGRGGGDRGQPPPGAHPERQVPGPSSPAPGAARSASSSRSSPTARSSGRSSSTSGSRPPPQSSRRPAPRPSWSSPGRSSTPPPRPGGGRGFLGHGSRFALGLWAPGVCGVRTRPCSLFGGESVEGERATHCVLLPGELPVEEPVARGCAQPWRARHVGAPQTDWPEGTSRARSLSSLATKRRIRSECAR